MNGDEMFKLTDKIGGEPVIGDPQITSECVYQCARVTSTNGNIIVCRMHPIRSPNAEDKWWPLYDCDYDLQHAKPRVSENDWADAKRRFKANAAIKSWRGDAEVDRYFSAPWNIKGLLQQGAIGWIYGKPGSYKSVMAMSMACSVATGTPWCGRETRKGPVLYISAEGGAGIYSMRDAWENQNGVSADYLAIHVGNPDIANLSLSGNYDMYDRKPHKIIQILKEFRDVLDQDAALIVIDTYAQTSDDDTKAAVTAYEKRIRRIIFDLAPSASVLVIDHTTKEGSSWMGSNAKLGNMDMMALLRKSGDDVILSMRGEKGKVKNAPSFDDIRMTPQLTDLGRQDAYGENAVAPVLQYCANTLTDREALLISLVGDGTTYGNLRKAWHEHYQMKDVSSPARKAALSRAIKVLREKDLLEVQWAESDQSKSSQKTHSITDECVILPL